MGGSVEDLKNTHFLGLAELWEALGELWEALYIQKLPINRPSGRYVIIDACTIKRAQVSSLRMLGIHRMNMRASACSSHFSYLLLLPACASVMAKPQFHWCDMLDEEDEEENALLRACIPNQRYWYDMEEYDMEYVDIAIPWLFQTSPLQSPSLSGDEEDLGTGVYMAVQALCWSGLESTDAPIDYYMPECIAKLTWIDEEGKEFKTYALRVRNLSLVDLCAHLLDFIYNQAIIIHEIDTCSITVSFGACTLKVQAHPWLTGLLLEFEMLAGEETAFQSVVGEAGSYVKEVDRHWGSM